MHERLISYLQDNRDYIIENWLTEADLPLPSSAIPFDGCQGTVPLAFLEGTFDRIISRISGKPCQCDFEHNQTVRKASSCSKSHGSGFFVESDDSIKNEIHLDNFLNVTCACALRRMGGRVCIELRDSGLTAFFSVFEQGWDAEAEFNEFESTRFKELISNAVTATFGDEVQSCQHRNERADCPFSIQ